MNDLKACRVLVTPRSYGIHDPTLRSELEAQVGEVIYNPHGRPPTPSELIELIAEVDGYIAGLEQINREVIQAAKRLKVIARYGVGVDAVDLRAARERGIIVTNTPGANAASVAELTVGLILALARHIPQADRTLRSGQALRIGGTSLEGKVVGLLGFGAVGQRVARRLVGFECSILACDPAADRVQAAQIGVQIVEQDELVRRADFLSLHAPATPDTYHLINAGLLARMKPGSFLINTARGELVDEGALLEALRDGHLAGAALDVLSELPPPADHPLLALPQVIVTPHIGAHTDGATNAMGRAALDDCLAVLRGQAPRFRVI